MNNASYPIRRHAFWDHESLVECMFCVVWRPTGKSVLSRVTCEALPPLTPASFSSLPPLFFTSSHHLGSRKHRTISTITDGCMTTPCQSGLCATLWTGGCTDSACLWKYPITVLASRSAIGGEIGFPGLPNFLQEGHLESVISSLSLEKLHEFRAANTNFLLDSIQHLHT